MQRVGATAPHSLDNTLCVLEIGIVGLAATFAARELGLSPIDALLAVFFTTALTGQFLVSLLTRRTS